MTIHLPEAEWEQAEPIDKPTELDEAWKPAAIVIGCIVTGLALNGVWYVGKLMGWWA